MSRSHLHSTAALLAVTLLSAAPGAPAAVTLSGKLDVTVADHFDPDAPESTHYTQVSYALLFDGTLLPLTFEGVPTHDLPAGEFIEVTGDYQPDGSFLATAWSDGMAPMMSQTECLARTGSRKVLAILVNLPNYTLPAGATTEHVKGVLLGNDFTTADNTPNWSVNDFWTQASDGQLTLDTGVTTALGPYTLPSNYNSNGQCFADSMRNAAVAAAAAHTDVTQFHNIAIIWPGNGAGGDCAAAGFAKTHCVYIDTPDGPTSFAPSVNNASKMLSRQRGVQLLTHELGHNLGLGHASKRDFGTVPLGGLGVLGSVGAYGSKFDTMGAWNFGLYNAPVSINQLGWLAPTTHYLTVESSGSYTIDNYEKRPHSVRALKIRRGTGNNAWLYVEYRADTGLYNSELSPQIHTGAMIHFDDGQFTDTEVDETHLLDFNADTETWNDPALELNEEWVDPHSNLTLKVTALSANSLTMQVTYGANPNCLRGTPTVVLNPASDSTPAGQMSTTVATVTNTSSAGCGPEQFGITASKWTGWTQTFSPGKTVTIAPGASLPVTINYTSPVTEPAGTRQSTVRAKSKSTPFLQSPNTVKFAITTP